jgi:small subunit ribosomal protein S30e
MMRFSSPPPRALFSFMICRSDIGFAAGKVHGSLARAGKVRGQTPKVAKQDKKKKPRGRAHKRMQYNRRFVTAVVGFGKKRGPNSSEK